MANIRAMRRTRQENCALTLGRFRRPRFHFLLHSVGLLTSIVGPAFLVCLAEGSILLFAAIVLYDALGTTIGVMLYQHRTRPAVVSIVSLNHDEASSVQLRPAA